MVDHTKPKAVRLCGANNISQGLCNYLCKSNNSIIVYCTVGNRSCTEYAGTGPRLSATFKCDSEKTQVSIIENTIIFSAVSYL